MTFSRQSWFAGPRPAFAAVGLGTLALYALFTAWVPLVPTNVYVPLLDLGKMTGYTWDSALRYMGLLFGLFTLYILGYGLVARGRAGQGAVFGFAAVFAFVLLWAYPATAVDVFGYIAHGRLLALHGVNPFIVPPLQFPADPIVPYLAFAGEPTQYGPLWVLLGAAITWLAGADLLGEVLLYKLVGALAHLAGAVLVLGTARCLTADLRRALAGAYLFAWNPLLLWEMVGNAHNDGLMMLGPLAAVWLLVRGRHTLVLPMVALGVLVKIPAVVVAPFLALALWQRDRAALFGGGAVAVALGIFFYRPFWEGLATLTFLYRGDLYTASLANALRLALTPLLGEQVAQRVARGIALALLAPLLLLLLAHTWRASARQVVTICYAALLAFLLLGITWFQAWYVVWPATLGAALPSPARHQEVMLLSLGAMGSYLVFIYLWVMGVIPGGAPVVQYTAFATIVGPLLLGWAVRAVRRR